MRRAIFVGGVLWSMALLVGLRAIAVYDYTPGAPAKPWVQWPPSTLLRRASGQATLVMFVHPRCPCSQASLTELAEIMARDRSRPAAYVICYRPARAGADWDKTAIERQAEAIPGVHVVRDIDGVESRRFHAETSGQTILYAPEGRLLFSGGITVSRGHSGENDGRAAILALIEHRKTTTTRTPVFGCALRGPDQK